MCFSKRLHGAWSPLSEVMGKRDAPGRQTLTILYTRLQRFFLRKYLLDLLDQRPSVSYVQLATLFKGV